MGNGWRYALITVIALHSFSDVSPRATADHPDSFLIGRHAEWKYFAEPNAPPADWNQPSFDDDAWRSGEAGIGYGDGDDRTVLDDMRGRYQSVYIRATFDLKEPRSVRSLYLYLRFDDGFIAYLNGIQVASASVEPTGEGLRVSNHEIAGYEAFPIRDASRLLQPGMNVIAIEGHNATLQSSDFSLAPVLSTAKINGAEGLVGREEYLQDLAEFEQRLLDQSSYLSRLDFDYKAAFKELRESLGDETSVAEFVSKLQKLLMQIGDCHARISSDAWPDSGRYLPLRPADTTAGIAALSINSDVPLDPQRPYIESIDSVPLDQWMDAAARLVVRGSPQLVRRRSLRMLGYLPAMRDEMGLPANEVVVIGLRSADGVTHSEMRLRPTGQRFSVAKIRTQATTKLAGNIGYLRIASMDARLVESTVDQLKSLLQTDGLIIDVRDNGGGTYALLRAIYGFFRPVDAKPYVTNIAAYRLSRRFAENHIAYRPTYRVQWQGWTDEERNAIQEAAAAFKPEWRPPAGLFSDWHYMVLSRGQSGQPANDDFVYDKPVVLLCNAGSFSATDGFLSAFADLPQVTIVGEPSGGGSGATRRFLLPHTQVTVSLSSMASFRANGKLFDGRGIEVDIEARPTLQDFVEGTDSVLERGIDLIQSQAK